MKIFHKFTELSLTAAFIASAGILSASTGFTTAVQVTGSSTGYLLENGRIYVVSGTVNLSNPSGGTYSSSGAYVDGNATTVIYVPKGATLNCTGHDSKSSYETGADGWSDFGGAGICLGTGRTLIITGEGTVNAQGGNAGNGYRGDGGGNADKDGMEIWTGKGGAGGTGGGGAGAGIGGIGGTGGNGGGGRNGDYWYEYEPEHHGDPGRPGNNGSSGSTMGTLYLLGMMNLNAAGGTAGYGGAGGKNGSRINDDYSARALADFGVGGGGGGAGGGGGCAANGVGGGGGGAGGGGGGACGGADYTSTVHDVYGPTGGGGYGGKGDNNGSRGAPEGPWSSNRGITACDGGAGGDKGSMGGHGRFFASPTASFIGIYVGTALTAYSHDAIAYTLTFADPDSQLRSVPTARTVYLGVQYQSCEATSVKDVETREISGYVNNYEYITNSVTVVTNTLPSTQDPGVVITNIVNVYDVTTNLVSVTTNYVNVTHASDQVNLGWFSERNGGGTKYFKGDGSPVKRTFDHIGDLTLYPNIGKEKPTGIYCNGTQVDSTTEAGRGSEDVGWIYEEGDLKLLSPDIGYRISGTLDDAATMRIVIENSAETGVQSYDLVFSNLVVSTGRSNSGGIVSIGQNVSANIKLEGNSYLKADNAEGTAGIYCPFGASVRLYSDTVNGTGGSPVIHSVLCAAGGNGAAAIGGANDTCGDITVENTLVLVRGGNGDSDNDIGNGTMPLGEDRTRCGNIVLNNGSFAYPILAGFSIGLEYAHSPDYTIAIRAYPKPHDKNGRPVYKIPNYFYWLPTGSHDNPVLPTQKLRVRHVDGVQAQ